MATRVRLAGIAEAVLLDGLADEVAETLNSADYDVALIEFPKYRARGLASGTVFIAPAHVASVESYEGG
jgi:hypothetical protein